MHFPSYVYAYSEPSPSPVVGSSGSGSGSGGGSTGGDGSGELPLSEGVGDGPWGVGLPVVGEGLGLPVEDALGVGVVDAVKLLPGGLGPGQAGRLGVPVGDGTRLGTSEDGSGTTDGTRSLVSSMPADGPRDSDPAATAPSASTPAVTEAIATTVRRCTLTFVPANATRDPAAAEKPAGCTPVRVSAVSPSSNSDHVARPPLGRSASTADPRTVAGSMPAASSSRRVRATSDVPSRTSP